MENVELVSTTPNAMELLKRVAGICYQVPPSEVDELAGKHTEGRGAE